MSNAATLFDILLESNAQAFAQGSPQVAYHALTGALYCAFESQDIGQIWQVHRIATEQYDHLQVQPETSTDSLELTLYALLMRLAHPDHIHGDSGAHPHGEQTATSALSLVQDREREYIQAQIERETWAEE